MNKKSKQSQKFIQKARELKCDEDERAFDDKLKKIVELKRPGLQKKSSKQ